MDRAPYINSFHLLLAIYQEGNQASQMLKLIEVFFIFENVMYFLTKKKNCDIVTDASFDYWKIWHIWLSINMCNFWLKDTYTTDLSVFVVIGEFQIQPQLLKCLAMSADLWSAFGLLDSLLMADVVTPQFTNFGVVSLVMLMIWTAFSIISSLFSSFHVPHVEGLL